MGLNQRIENDSGFPEELNTVNYGESVGHCDHNSKNKMFLLYLRIESKSNVTQKLESRETTFQRGR